MKTTRSAVRIRKRLFAWGVSAAAVAIGIASPLAVASVHGNPKTVLQRVMSSPSRFHESVEEPACSAAFFDEDKRLGPSQLPNVGEDGQELLGYRRTGDLTAARFLDIYFKNGSWIYPPADGYIAGPNGHIEEARLELYSGQQLDRYGSEYGAFLSPEGLPYAARSIPPQNLDSSPAAACNYHSYRVVKPFAVEAGPIAAWFGQPGGGTQFQLVGHLVPGAPSALNVMWLVDSGYLTRSN